MKIKPAIVLLVTMLAANDVQAADLLDVFHSAQANDPVIAAARATQQAGREKLPQGRSLLMPTVNLSANSTTNNQNVQYLGYPLTVLSGNYRYNSNGYGVTLVQPLYRQQNWVAYSEAELQVAQTDAQLRIAEQDLVLRTAQAYFDVLIAQDSVQLAQAQKSAIAEQLAQAKRNFEVGSATITDTDEAQARHDLTYSQEIAAQNNLEIKRGLLQQLISALPQDLKSIGPQFKPEAPLPADMAKWVNDAELNNPQLAIAHAGFELAKKEVEKNRGGHYPTLDMVANYSTNNVGGSMASDITTRSIGVQLNVPIFEGGAVNSRWREAEANRERARQELENARRSVEQQTRQAYLGVVSGAAQVYALQQALTSSVSVLEASKLGQEVGVRTNLDVLNAQQQLYSTRRDLYQAQYNYLVSELRLKASVGELGEAELAKVNQALH
jgi:outer membrane protein